MKYLKTEIETLKPLAQEMVDELNQSVDQNLDDVYKNIHRYLLDDKRTIIKRCEKEAKAFKKENTVKSMVEYIVDWGQTNGVTAQELKTTFKDEVDWEVFGVPGDDWPMGY
jgi:hypothetical protein